MWWYLRHQYGICQKGMQPLLSSSMGKTLYFQPKIDAYCDMWCKIFVKCIMGKCEARKLQGYWILYQKGEWLQISHSKNKQLERETYVSREGEEKLALIDKMVKLDEFLHSLKLKLEDFTHHWFNVQPISEVYNELVSKLDNHTIVKVLDFSENYKCL